MMRHVGNLAITVIAIVVGCRVWSEDVASIDPQAIVTAECAGACEPPPAAEAQVDASACQGMPPVCGTTADCPGAGDTCCSGECLPPEAGVPVTCDVITCPEGSHVGRDASCTPACVPAP